MLRDVLAGLRRLDRRGQVAVGASFCALLLIGGVAGWTSLRGKPDDTVMAYIIKAGLDKKRELLVGVFPDEPLMSYRDPSASPDSHRIEDYSGFDVEMARALGQYLGFRDANLIMIPTEVQDRARDLNEGRIDVAIASYSMTDEREKEVDFAGPYMRTQPEVLMRADSKVTHLSFRDLGEMGARICTTGSSTSEAAMLAKGIHGYDGVNRAKICVDGLRSGKYDAFVLDEAVLAGYKHMYPTLKIVDLVFDQTEYYAIAVANDNEPLRILVQNFLLDSLHKGDDGAWKQAWNKTLGQVLVNQIQPKPVKLTVILRQETRQPADAMAVRQPARLRRRPRRR